MKNEHFLTIMFALSCSGGYFIAVKEVSLLDQGEQGKQSVLQLEQVNEACVFYCYISRLSYDMISLNGLSPPIYC